MSEENKIQLYRGGVLSRIKKFSAVIGESTSPDPDGDIDFHYILRVLLDRYRTVLFVGVCFAILALVVSLLMTPVYRSEATLEIKGSAPEMESLQALQSPNAAPDNVVVTEVATQIGILTSDKLARQVINQVILAQPDSGLSVSSIFSNAWNGIVHWWTGTDVESSPADVTSSAASAATVSPESKMDPKDYERLVVHFKKKLDVQQVGTSRLISVSFESHDPRLAARVVNALISDYLKMHQEATAKLTKVLAQQVEEAKKDLEKAESSMTQYARRNGLLYLETDNGASQNIVSQRLHDLQAALTTAQADRYQKESVYNLVKKGDYSSLPGVFQDTLLQNLTTQLATLKSQYAQLSATFTDNYPSVKAVKKQIASVEEMLDRERQRAAANITNNYLASVRQEALLLHQFEVQKNLANHVAEKSDQYDILKRTADSENQLYDNLLQKVKEASLVAQIKADNVDVIERAVPQYLPVRPKILLYMFLGLVLGMALGVGLAFLEEHIDSELKRRDTSVKTVDEIDRFLGVPALAIIPSVESISGLIGNGNNNGDHGESLADQFDESTLTKTERPYYRIDKQFHQKYSPLVEAFRALGSSVMLEASGQKRLLRSIVVTSSQPGEGKTTVSVNLAIALAQQGMRVFLIDADLRRPAIHRALGFRNIRGLSGYLAGLSEWAPCVLPGLTPGLDTLPAGKNPQNPVALLSSPRMKNLIGRALEEYDYVIVDSPALMLNLADARILAGLVDGSILVVRSGMAPREFVIRARKHLNNVVGVVLNSMDVRSTDYYYGYGGDGTGPVNEDEKSGDSSYEKRIAGM